MWQLRRRKALRLLRGGPIGVIKWNKYRILNPVPDLSEADLSGEWLCKADLIGADLSGANLIGTNLSEARLGKANLSGANLNQADFRFSSLVFANLDGADISGARLYGTARDDWSIEGIVCTHVYWDVHGEHRTPPDRDLEPGKFEKLYAPVSQTERGPGSPSGATRDIFLSYARVDIERVKPIVRVLEAEGWSVWWDSDILPGEDFRDVIEAALVGARAVVVVWSRSSADSGWVRAEAEHGRERGVLVPVVLDGSKPPLDFRTYQTADLTGWHGAPSRLDGALARLHSILDRAQIQDGDSEATD